MTQVPEPLADLLRELAAKRAEVDELTRRIDGVLAEAGAGAGRRTPLHARRVIKEGMESFFLARTRNPYAPDSDEYGLWQLGFDVSRDGWAENGAGMPAAVSAPSSDTAPGARP